MKNRNNTNVSNEREERKYLWYLWELGATRSNTLVREERKENLTTLQWHLNIRLTMWKHLHIQAKSIWQVFSSEIKEVLFILLNSLVIWLPMEHEGKTHSKVCVLGWGPSGCFVDMEETWKYGQMKSNKSLSCCCDIGGRSAKADYSVTTVFDRFYMMDGDKPSVVAHNGMDTPIWIYFCVEICTDSRLLQCIVGTESNTLWKQATKTEL